MKSTTAIALILGLIMLLLVMVAAFLFLFQGRNTLQEQRNVAQVEVTTLQESLAQVTEDVAVIGATRTAAEAALTVAISDTVILEGQLVQSQLVVDDLTSQLESASQTMSTLASTQVPEVAILAPANGATLPVDQMVEIVLVASDGRGITAVTILLNDEPLQEFTPTDDTLFTETIEWTPTTIGPYDIAIVAENANGVLSELTTISVEVNEIQTAPSSALPDPNADLRAQIETAVSDIRGLEPLEPVTRTLLTRDEIRTRFENDFFAEYTEEDALNETYVLASFDFLPIDFALRDFWLDFFSETVSGFYDAETNEFVVVSEDDALSPAEQKTYAHEFVHVLQDQHYALDLLNDDTLSADAKMALRALVEGEAEFIEDQFVPFAGADSANTGEEPSNEDPTFADDVPSVLIENVAFPYVTGTEFVTMLHDEGAFGAINYAWANLPQSTEQIIHPDRFLEDDFPQEVTLPEFSFGSDWMLADEDVFGEAMLRSYLRQQLNEDQVETAATGWGGDRYAVYHNPETNELIMILRQVWDSEEDSNEFAALYPNYASRLLDAESLIQPNGRECWVGDNDVICLHQIGSETTIVRAPTLEIVESIMAEIRTED